MMPSFSELEVAGRVRKRHGKQEDDGSPRKQKSFPSRSLSPQPQAHKHVKENDYVERDGVAGEMRETQSDKGEIERNEIVADKYEDKQTVSNHTDQRGRPLYDLKHAECRPSLLSHHVKTQNLKGFYNLFVIVLLATNARLVVENIMKYGVMIELPRSPQDILRNWPLLACFMTMHLFILSAWVIERYVAVKVPQSSNVWVTALQLWNYGVLLLVPYLTVSQFKPYPAGSVLLLSFSVVWCFKFLSFHHVCFDTRRAIMNGEDLDGICLNKKEAVCARNYPESVSLRHLYRFIVMPTMCFQFHYPLTPSIRWLSVARHTVEALVLMSLAKILFEQYILITVRNTFSFSTLQSISLSTLIGHLTERILKLSVPNLYVWLLMFMAIFHHYCNILAELTRFGDRHFYDDWWNASSFGEYWRKWNLPIHHFLNRHVNKPLLRKGVSKPVAGLTVFAISALLHEYIVVVPLHLPPTGWVFGAFLVQIPFIYITDMNFVRSLYYSVYNSICAVPEAQDNGERLLLDSFLFHRAAYRSPLVFLSLGS
eukprot:GHVQ01004615.1.p1 GENE.GHVQ01004615.1~~GHVQ01004615.1.p1  ORF type:complete len:540 (+),score=31.92 GHVQ01004615.1:206-1825(+)